jgi:hypothetical protein
MTDKLICKSVMKDYTDLIWAMNQTYNKEAEKLKGFPSYRFKAMEAAMRALWDAGYELTKR